MMYNIYKFQENQRTFLSSLTFFTFTSQPAIAGILQEGRRSLARTERGLGTARARLGAVRARLGAARARLGWGGFAAGRNPGSIYKRNPFKRNLRKSQNFAQKIEGGSIFQKKSL